MDISYIKKLNLFQDLNDKELDTVSKLLMIENYPKDHVLFRRGDRGDKLYIISKGAVRISLEIENKKEEALAVLNAGEHFGEMALVDDAPRSADVIIHEDAELLVLSKENFKEISLNHRDIAYKMFWVLLKTISSRLRNSINQTEALIHICMIC
ncbi:MAG: cyclic nucleotide-binding domain-containing protein [Deltaproteobacteria bacterium]|uniref:Cyclic nucleotide-binding domain-containing protein n=1 Tax=Candidatus Zymogenus saltonus TaxID=2844893 RepID=A0A9D8KD44_9DELT|nr:cyclic nucleotide-binding domain-containing protein [Candidatus Zymogenus saltonus]